MEKNINENILNDLVIKFVDNDFTPLFDYLRENNIKISKKIKMVSLINALRFDVMTTRQKCLTLDNRKNYRLLWFNLFTEFQLEELFIEFQKSEILNDYIHNVIKGIIINLSKSEKDHISKVKMLECGEKNNSISFEEFNKMFSEIEYEPENTFEGVKIEKIRAILFNSATIEEIKKLGLKYNVEIPETFNGDNLRQYLISKLRVLAMLTNELENEILTAPITKVRDIAKEKNINTLKLNKKESIEFILIKALGENYKLPISDLDYEMAIPLDANNEKYSELLFEYEKVNNELIILREKLQTAEESNKKAIEEMIKEKEALKEKYDQELKTFKKEIISIELNQALSVENTVSEKKGKTFRLWLYTFIASIFALMIGICFYLILKI